MAVWRGYETLQRQISTSLTTFTAATGAILESIKLLLRSLNPLLLSRNLVSSLLAGVHGRAVLKPKLALGFTYNDIVDPSRWAIP
jgi:hypothetical protein